MKTINFISGSMQKLGEVRAILGNTVDVQNQKLEIPEIQGSIQEIALAKCRAAAEEVSSGSVFDLADTTIPRQCPFLTHYVPSECLDIN